MQRLFRRFVFIFLALHALVDLILAPIIYHQVGILAPGIFLIIICGLFTYKLGFALRKEEFYSRWFPGIWARGPIDMASNPIAFWFTFVILAIFHLFITVKMALVVHW